MFSEPSIHFIFLKIFMPPTSVWNITWNSRLPGTYCSYLPQDCSDDFRVMNCPFSEWMREEEPSIVHNSILHIIDPPRSVLRVLSPPPLFSFASRSTEMHIIVAVLLYKAVVFVCYSGESQEEFITAITRLSRPIRLMPLIRKPLFVEYHGIYLKNLEPK